MVTQKYSFKESIGRQFKKVSGIYIIYIQKHFYIGSSNCIYERLQRHRKSLRKGAGINQKIQNAYNKYGEDECYWGILEICEESKLLMREEYWINYLNSDLNINKYPTQLPAAYKAFNCKNPTSKTVYQYDLDGNYLNEYPSVNEASRQLHVESRAIASCAAHKDPKYKSAYGYMWSYLKLDKMPKYINNSAKAKIVSINIFDIITGTEYEFTSIAEAVRILNISGKNFDSKCAIVSSACSNRSILDNKYLCKYKDSVYKIPTRKTVIINLVTLQTYKNALELARELNVHKDTIRNRLNKNKLEHYKYLCDVARVKLCESGKLLEDNPNPSLIEIQERINDQIQ